MIPSPRSAHSVRWLILILSQWLLHVTLLGAGQTPPPMHPLVQGWLAAQPKIQTWTADFTQTRTLKALTQPLTAQGRIFFAAPNQFRWELEQPAQTIALRRTNEMIVIYPLLRRLERFSLSPQEKGPWREALALLEAGFPRSQTELESKFKITAVHHDADLAQVHLEPKSHSARRFLPHIQIGFSVEDYSLRFTQLEFSDGSTLRNDFFHAILNPPLPEHIFTPPIDPSFKVIEPMKNQRRGR